MTTNDAPSPPLASTSEALTRLEALSTGLVYVSETDSPLTVVRLGASASDPKQLQLAVAGAATGALELSTVAEFFEPALREQAFHTAEDRLVVERYRLLVEFLTKRLTETQVLRIGTIDIDVYAVGKSSEGEWVGVATKIVET